MPLTADGNLTVISVFLSRTRNTVQVMGPIVGLPNGNGYCKYESLVYARLRPSMEKLLSAAITYLMVLKLEPWDMLHIREQHGNMVT
ncbi:hypothetical protein PENNAL_c0648G07105, partial [Penicillium nalgiovense]